LDGDECARIILPKEKTEKKGLNKRKLCKILKLKGERATDGSRVQALNQRTDLKRERCGDLSSFRVGRAWSLGGKATLQLQ